MAITKKDLRLINEALAYFQNAIIFTDPEESYFFKSLNKDYGDIKKQIINTRNRIFAEMDKRGVEA